VCVGHLQIPERFFSPQRCSCPRRIPDAVNSTAQGFKGNPFAVRRVSWSQIRSCRGNKPSQGPTASPGLESQSRQMLVSNRSSPYTTRLPLGETAGKLAHPPLKGSCSRCSTPKARTFQKFPVPAPELEELKKISRPSGLQTGQQLINESLQRSQTSRLRTPKLKMSDRASTFFPSACYGDM